MMPNAELQIGDIRLLHLSRNAPSLLVASEDSLPSDEERDVCRFSMFDYFDWLTVRKGDILGYEEVLGLEHRGFKRQEFPCPTVSSQYLILATLKGESVLPSTNVCKVGDPFFDEGNTERPFLSLLLVTVLPDLEPISPNFDSQCVRPEDVSSFLRICADELRHLVMECCGGTQAGCPEEGLTRAVFQVYHSLSSGSFCIVVRSRDALLAHSVAVQVRAATLNQDRRFGFPAVNCGTFSLIGVACPPDCGQWELLGRTIGISGVDVSLRMSVTNDVLETLSQCASCLQSIEPRGLYGRYDLTILLKMEQFGQLYPWICAHKLGSSMSKVMGGGSEQDVVAVLRDILDGQGVLHINSRLLLPGVANDAAHSDRDRHRKLQERVKKENNEISALLKKIGGKGDDLLYCQEEYQTCMRMLSDLWESYSSLRYQDDSFIGGNMLLTQMSLLLEIVHNYLKSIPEDNPPREAFQTLVICLRLAINSIDHFQKLMLSVNQQSIQAPNYEIQMHTDMEKFVVAYTEFSRRFLAEHFTGVPTGLDNARQMIYPIITVNVTLEAIQATPLFLLPYLPLPNGLIGSNERQEYVLLSVEIPDNGFFGDIYTILPLIAHELSHNFRVQGRRQRNDKLAKFLFHKIAQIIVRKWIALENETGLYYPFGSLENELFIDNLTELLFRAYHKQCKIAHGTANIGALLRNIKLFLFKYIFTKHSTNQLCQPGFSIVQVRNQLDRFCRLALDASDTETPTWIGAYQDCLALLKKAEKGKPADWERFGRALVAIVPKLAVAVRDGHLVRVDQSCEALCSALKSEGEFGRVATKIRMNLGNLCVNAPLNSSPAQVDQWIKKVKQERVALNEQIELATKAPKAIIHIAKNLDYAICDLCRAAKDANQLSMLLFSFSEEDSDLDQDIRNNLIKDYHAKIRLELDQYCSDSSTEGLLYSSPMIRELIVPLGVDLEDETLFSQSMKRILFYTNQNDIDYILECSTTLYRETFADLGMCVSLNLTPFGYLNVLAHNEFFQNMNDIPSNMRAERMSLVCSALLDPGGKEKRLKNDAFKILQKECKRYADELYRYLEQSALLEAKNREDWIKLQKRVYDLLECRYYEDSLPSFQLTKLVFHEWMRPGVSQETEQELYCQLQSLWYMANLFNHLAADVETQKEHALLDEFRTLLTNCRKKWQDERAESPESMIQAKVGETYNSPEQLFRFLNRPERFEDTLAFIMYYYYHGWNMYGCGIHANTDGWLNALMGRWAQ